MPTLSKVLRKPATQLKIPSGFFAASPRLLRKNFDVYHKDLTTKKDFMKKYQELAEIYSKNLENHRFLVYHPSNDGHVTGPQS